MEAHGDAMYVIGSMHTVCEDYARAMSSAGRPYIIVADGCSASPDTDIGARLLAMAAGAYLNTFTDNAPIEPRSLALAARRLASGCGLPQTCLDSTLLLARLLPERGGAGTVEVTCFGDGSVVCRDRASGALEITTVSFPGGAPYYLSYLLDAGRRRILFEHGLKKVVRVREVAGADTTLRDLTECEDEGALCTTVCVDVDRVDLVALFSDGVETFVDRREDRPRAVPLEAVVSELLAFKNYQGRFVERRMRRFLKAARERRWIHEDDLSLAALSIG